MQPSHQRQSVSKPSSIVRPGELLLPMRAKLRGSVQWRTYDERGVPEVPRNPGGFAIAPIEGVRQPNLITDSGMDQLATFDCQLQAPASQSWRRYLRVGTGSVTPAFTDTALAAQAQVDATSGTFPNGSNTGELDTVTNEWVGYLMATRIVAMTNDRNLTEFGLSPELAGNLCVRELLRDGGGTPITVSLLNGKTLRVDHTLEVRIPAPAAGHSVSLNREEYDAANNLVATVPMDVTYGFWTPTASSNDIASGFQNADIMRYWNPMPESPPFLRRFTSAWAYARSGSGPIASDIDPLGNFGGSVAPGPTFVSYTPGSHQRVKRWTVGAGTANTAWHGAAIGLTSGFGGFNNQSFFALLFTSPATYTKVNTDELRFGLVSTWARA
jgi:hypothetical protein